MVRGKKPRASWPLRSPGVASGKFPGFVAAVATGACDNSSCGGKPPPWAGPPRDRDSPCPAVRPPASASRLPRWWRGAPVSRPTPLRGGTACRGVRLPVTCYGRLVAAPATPPRAVEEDERLEPITEVILEESSSADSFVRVTCWIDGHQDLNIEGYSSGRVTRDFTGHDDEEYIVSVLQRFCTNAFGFFLARRSGCHLRIASGFSFVASVVVLSYTFTKRRARL